MTNTIIAGLICLSAVQAIESSGDPLAYNKHSGARGLYQITEICLADYNQYHTQQYTLEQLYDPEINEKIAAWYLLVRIPQMLDHYNIIITPDNILWAYNAGIGKVRKGIMPEETKNYIKKYHKLTGGDYAEDNISKVKM